MIFENLLRSMERTFMSTDTMLSKIYGKRQLEKCLIVSGGQETPMIDTHDQYTVRDQYAVAVDNTGKVTEP